MFLLVYKDFSAVECTGTTGVDRRTCTYVKTLLNVEGFLRNCSLQRLLEDPCVSLSKLCPSCILVVAHVGTRRCNGKKIHLVCSPLIYFKLPFSLLFYSIVFYAHGVVEGVGLVFKSLTFPQVCYI